MSRARRLALLVLALGAGVAAPLRASVQDPEPRARTETRLFDLSDLPRAPLQRWRDWGPTDEPPAELRAELGGAMGAYSARDYVGAGRGLRTLLEREPDFPPALYQLGLCAFRLRRYGDCAAVYERFLEVVPHEVGATQALGHCYYSLGSYEAARVHYECVLAVNGESVEAVRGYALTLLRLGEEERALELLQQVVKLRPGHADAWLEIAQIQDDAGALEAALESALHGRDLAPQEPRAWFLLSRIWSAQGRAEEARHARSEFERLSRSMQRVRQIEGRLLHHPSDRELLMQLAQAQRSAGDRGVFETLEFGLSLFPRDLDWHLFALGQAEALEERAALAAVARACETRFPAEPALAQRLLGVYARLRDRAGEQRMRERIGD